MKAHDLIKKRSKHRSSVVVHEKFIQCLSLSGARKGGGVVSNIYYVMVGRGIAIDRYKGERGYKS